MREVQLQHIEARIETEPSGSDELVSDRIHVGARHRARGLADAREVWQSRRREQRPIVRTERVIHAFPAELCRTFSTGMADLQAKPGGRLSMDELDDPPPCIPLRLIPQTGTPGSDASRGRNTGHLSEQEPGAADRPCAVV